jgi:hypothetical protein
MRNARQHKAWQRPPVRQGSSLVTKSQLQVNARVSFVTEPS